MIKELKNRVAEWSDKRNWIDQNGVVFGYGDTPECCERWGWGVFDEETHERLHDSPDGLPYHFDFDAGVKEADYSDVNVDAERPPSMYERRNGEYISVLNTVRVRLLPDDGGGRSLIFEAYTDHNGYYLHSFSFAKEECREFVETPREGTRKEDCTAREEMVGMGEEEGRKMDAPAPYGRVLKKVAEHYRHAVEGHPYFCDGVTAVRSREDAAYWLKLGRERVRDAAAVGGLTATRLIDLAALKMMEASVRGDNAAAVDRCYDAIAVLLRTVDVLEGRQPLGRPDKEKKEGAE